MLQNDQPPYYLLYEEEYTKVIKNLWILKMKEAVKISVLYSLFQKLYYKSEKVTSRGIAGVFLHLKLFLFQAMVETHEFLLYKFFHNHQHLDR